MTEPFDKRITPFRPDLAAAFLQGKVEAARFAEGLPRMVVAGVAALRRAPAADARIESELLFGESFTSYEETAGWAWGQSGTDGYVGYVRLGDLAAPGRPPTHRVSTPATHLYPAADFKLPPLQRLSLGARLAVRRPPEGRFAEVEGGFVPVRHLMPLGSAAPDFVAVAESLIGVPYLWGGRSSLGLDCSGLVQVSLAAAGVAAPRDSDMQEAALGTRLGGAEAAGALRRGDLLFWKGHVAIALDGTRMIHANAWAMAVAVEELAGGLKRIAATDGPVTAIKRL